MPKHRIKVAVTGAAGQIGYAMLFRIAQGDMFGPETEIELNLLELPAALPALQGVVMELLDGAFPLLKKVTPTDDLPTAMRDVNWAILVGSVPRKAAMERADLLKINGAIFSQQGKAINDYAAEDARVFVVGNPCNTNCLIAMHHAPRIPRKNFFAMTLLDENRARTQLALKAGVDVPAVENMIIWGNHSATQYPDFYHATIHHTPVTQHIPESWLKENFIACVQQRGAEVIKARGASSAASAAHAAIGSVYRLTQDTPAGHYFSVASCSEGHYGVDEGLIFSFPSRTEKGTLHIASDWTHNAFGQEKIAATLHELRAEYETVRTLGLIPSDKK